MNWNEYEEVLSPVANRVAFADAPTPEFGSTLDRPMDLADTTYSSRRAVFTGEFPSTGWTISTVRLEALSRGSRAAEIDWTGGQGPLFEISGSSSCRAR